MTRLACRVLLLVSLGALVALPTLLATGAPVAVDESDSEAVPVDDSNGNQQGDASGVTQSSITVQNITDKNGDLVGYYIDEEKDSSEGQGMIESWVNWIVNKMPFVGGDNEKGEEEDEEEESSGSPSEDEEASFVHVPQLGGGDSEDEGEQNSGKQHHDDGKQHHGGDGEHRSSPSHHGGDGEHRSSPSHHSGDGEHHSSPSHHSGDGEHHSGNGEHSNLPTANGIHGAPPHAGNSDDDGEASIPHANGPHGGPPSSSHIRPVGGVMPHNPPSATTEAPAGDEE